MKRLALLAIIGFAVTGCDVPQPATFAYKPATNSVKKADDWTSCEIEAAQRVPVNTQVGQTPTFVTPMYTTCGAYSCYTSGGQVMGGDVYSYDANAELRNRAQNQCMARKGYQLYEANLCKKSQIPEGLSGNPTAQIIHPEGNFCIADLGGMSIPVAVAEEK